MDEQQADKQAREALLSLIGVKHQKNEIDVSDLRYVIYARKSTLNEDRQEKSIEDQVRICRETAKSRGLNIVDIIEEKGSAKEPDTRPKFMKMLDDLKFGKIDGIMAWHADRLSRNMKEAGIIIDMLDRGTIKNLQFATSHFDNNPTGKMLLGISFVLSKQYSEHLSESVTRGNNARTEQGEFIGKLKHGYWIDNNKRLFPDGNNFALIKEAFDRRLNGDSIEDIAQFLNKSNYMRSVKDGGHTKFRWDKQKLSKQIFRDPFHCGILVYGDSHADLGDFYDFTPAVSASDFLRINNVGSFDENGVFVLAQKSLSSKEKTRADLWRGLVRCSICKSNMHSGITTKKDKSTGKTIKEYYYYKCPNKHCPNHSKNFRPRYILKFMQEFFTEHINAFQDENLHKEYSRQFEETLIERRRELQLDLKSVNSKITYAEKHRNEIKDFIIKPSNEAMAKYYQEDLEQAEKDIKRLREEKEQLKHERDRLLDSKKTYVEYLELMQKIPDLLRSELDMATLDEIGRIFFSNFSITEDKSNTKQRYKVEYKLKEPWDRLFKIDVVNCGAPD